MRQRSNILGLLRVVIGLLTVCFVENLLLGIPAFGAGWITRVSVDSAGIRGNGPYYGLDEVNYRRIPPSISGDGRL